MARRQLRENEREGLGMREIEGVREPCVLSQESLDFCQLIIILNDSGRHLAWIYRAREFIECDRK